MMNVQLRELIERCVESKSAHLIDLVLRGSNHKTVIEVFVDAESGVTTTLCSEISREISDALSLTQLLSRDYMLTVSSPGVDRPLKFFWQYTKHIGRQMRMKLNTETGVQDVTGKCVAVDEQAVTLETTKPEQSIRVAFASIREAKVQVPW